MGVFDFLRRTPEPTKKPRRRNYEGAKVSRLVSGWATNVETANNTLKVSLRELRARSRDLERNNPHVTKFFKTAEKNILGKDGIRLQMRVTDPGGGVDEFANRIIEEAWARWCKKGSVTMCGGLSFRQAEGLFLRSVMRDGAGLVRLVSGNRVRNPFKFALHFLEVDHIDHDLEKWGDGTRIQMGIEHDEWMRALNYYILQDHPGDHYQGRKSQAIAAENVLHGFIRERAGQLHGVPWLAQAIIRLRMLDGYEEAELVAARAGAAKMGFLIDQEGEDYDGDDEAADGAVLSDFEAGTIERLPPGFDFKGFDPQHPNSGFDAFVKGILRSVASGLDISYAGFTGDLTQVNFSSIRQGEIADRDAWRMLQGWMVQEFHAPIFERWLEWAMATGQLAPLRSGSFDKYNKPFWQGRGWQWVDPLKDAQANLARYEQRTKSLSEIASEEGRDLEEVVQQIKRDKALLEANGLQPEDAAQSIRALARAEEISQRMEADDVEAE